MSPVLREGDPAVIGPPVELGSESPPRDINEGHKKLLFSENHSDVVFKVGPNVAAAATVRAHSQFLVAQSSVFATMFSDNWRNGQPIEIVDCEAPEFRSLLRFIYCNELVFPTKKLNDVIKLAHKYMIFSLINFVTANMGIVDKKYALWCHSLAIQLELVDMREKCLQLLTSDLPFNLTSEDFVEASSASLGEILSKERSADNLIEMFLFESCLEWSKKECERQGLLEVVPANQRKMMEPFIHKFSFETMTNEEFARLPCESGILSGDEQAAILRIKAGVSVQTRFRKRGPPVANKRCRHW